MTKKAKNKKGKEIDYFQLSAPILDPDKKPFLSETLEQTVFAFIERFNKKIDSVDDDKIDVEEVQKILNNIFGDLTETTYRDIFRLGLNFYNCKTQKEFNAAHKLQYERLKEEDIYLSNTEKKILRDGVKAIPLYKKALRKGENQGLLGSELKNKVVAELSEDGDE